MNVIIDYKKPLVINRHSRLGGFRVSVPSHFGRYRVLRPLASGEMGVVYLAEDPLIGRQVAIKGIRFDPCTDDEEIQRLQERFDQEIQIAGTFSHPNIVTLYDVGRQGGHSFIAMEYVDGRNLRAELQATGPLSTDAALKMIVPLCRGLSYAHERGVVHRDIKPTNILVSSKGIPKITDFGVARLFGSTLTNAGKIFGTPAYMSPEQAKGGPLSGASDQFAIAAVAYELVTGERPFTGNSPTAVIYEVIEHHPAPPHEVAALVPTAVSATIMRGLEKDPKDRFDTCDAFADALKEALAWSKANPELAYLGGPAPRDPTGETTLVNWRAAVARVRQHTEHFVATVAASKLWAQARHAAVRVAVNPRGLAAFATGSAALVLLVTAVTWAASSGGPVDEFPAPVGPEPGVLAATKTTTGGLPDRERGVSRGPESPVLDAGAPPAPVEQPAMETPASNLAPGAAVSAPATHSFVVSSRPAGAQVSLNGEPLGEASPLTIEVQPGERYSLRLEKEGYAPLSWVFTLEQLSAAHRESGMLYFPLQSLAPESVEEQLIAPAGTPVAEFVEPGAAGSDEVETATATGAAGPVGGPPPSPANIRRVRAPADAPAPEKLRHVEPSLPASVSTDGVVVLEIEISARGNVVQAKVLRGLDPLSDQAALDAVVRWKYQPTQLSGTPVHVVMTVTVPMRHSR